MTRSSEQQEPENRDAKPEKEEYPPELQRILNRKRAEAQILRWVGDAKEARPAKEE